MDHVEVDTWKAWRPLFFGNCPKCPEFGHWKVYHFRSRISTCIYGTLRVFTSLFSLAEHGAPKGEVPFLCVKRFMFTWAMDHGYEIIALAGQPPEPTHAKCINAAFKKAGCQVPFTDAARGPEVIPPNSFCGFIFTRPIDMNFHPPFPHNPLN